jgi:hypothetical protein
MQLTLEQTATRLGKSKRQVLYMIQTGRLPAQKIAGRWSIESDRLPRNEAQQRADERKQRQLRAAVEEALEIPPESTRSKRYSVRDLKAFQIALPLHEKAVAELGAEHPATSCLKHVLEQLTQGCHRFERSDKAEAYRAARDQASLAVCELVLSKSAPADQLIHTLEQDLMASLAGLLRRVDRQKHP